MKYGKLSRYIGWLLLPILLVGCVEARHSQSDPLGDSELSKADKVQLGMDRKAVEEILGPRFTTLFEGDPLTNCDSHIYNVAFDARFVHVYYKSDTVFKVSDGHNNTCAIH